MDIRKLYEYYIYKRYAELKASGKEIDNYDLCKIFELYTCIKLSEMYGTPFYEYNDIDSTFKEDNNMSRNDTGIDACNLVDTIVQCKLRKQNLSFQECATFFASQIAYDQQRAETIVRWKKTILARNSECKLSRVLEQKSNCKLFIDRPFPQNEMIDYCESLLVNPPQIANDVQPNFQLRNYQIEAIEIIKSTENSVICLPTGCGKNIVIIHSLDNDKRYLILVPRIILMDQLYDEIIKHKPYLKHSIQCIGDGNNIVDDSKKIYICVYNSIGLLENRLSTFDKIYIDEAHHIYKPIIYQEMEDIEDTYIEAQNNSSSSTSVDDEIINSDLENDEIESVDLIDTEDELQPNKYINIVRGLVKYKNNVYLSATIDEIDGFAFYKKDLREMIEKRYLCDYNIHVPIFDDDPNNKNICEYIIKNYRNSIIYCNSRSEGQFTNKLMNEIQPGCCEYIDCNTRRHKRDHILSKYRSDTVSFLVNVRVLVEGFDAPITKNVIFLHLPSDKTTLVQIIGRALRLHPLKTVASIVLPFSKIEDEKNITNFMRVMAKNDRRIMRSYVGKKLGGYIEIEDLTVEDDNNDIEFKFNVVYNSFGQLVNNVEIWYYYFQKTRLYIDKNGKRPSSSHRDTKQLGYWVSSQLRNYKNKLYSMKNDNIYNEWHNFINSDQYRPYFMSNEDMWYQKYYSVIEYIDKNGKKPSVCDKNKDIELLSWWISGQMNNYKNRSKIMKNNDIYNEWHNFINSVQYRQYFMSSEDIWYQTYSSVIEYINKNGKKPPSCDKNKDVKYMGCWIKNQISNYKNRLGLMKNDDIYNQWSSFIDSDKYRQHFMSNENIWYRRYYLVIEYIDKNNERPSSKDKNEDVARLGLWMACQMCNYKNRSQTMKNNQIYNEWHNFINSDRYKKFFISNEDNWYQMYYSVVEYIDKNQKKPSPVSKNEVTKQLGCWLSTQMNNYKNRSQGMKNDQIYNEWHNFINSDRYRKYFVSYEDNWYQIYYSVIQYIDKNGKKPSAIDENKNTKKLGNWISTQMTNYRKKYGMMKNLKIYNDWGNFINSEQYKQYFL